MKLPRAIHEIRRGLGRVRGSGPWTTEPFSQIVARRNDVSGGVHVAETFSGVLHAEEDTWSYFKPVRSVFGEEPAFAPVDGGPRYRPGGFLPATRKELLTLTEAGVAGDDGVVYCAKTRVAVRETLRTWTAPVHSRSILGLGVLPEPTVLPGIALDLATLSGGGFYHLLIESLPKLWLARDVVDRVDHVLVNGFTEKGLAGWFAAAGVPAQKIIWLKPLSHYRFDQVIFTGPLMGDQRPSTWTTEATNQLLRAEPAAPPSKRIWISRQGAKARHLSWEDQLVERLPGFTRVRLDDLSPHEQIRLIREAQIVAGPHGAGLASIIFATPGTQLLEIHQDQLSQPIYQRLTQLRDGTYHWAAVDFARAGDVDRLAAAIRASLKI